MPTCSPVRSPAAVVVLAVALGFVAPVASAQAPPAPPIGCALFPADNYWHADVSQLPVRPDSATLIDRIGRGAGLHTDFGAGLYDGGIIGIPYTTVPAGQPRVPVRFVDYGDESDPGPYPIPPNAPVEGQPVLGGDQHVLVVEEDACTLWELFNAERQGDGSWTASSGARYDLRSNALRPAGWTSADAAGLPILPGLVRYDEVAAGVIDHAIRFTAPATREAFVWPARHEAGDPDPSLPPMGLWLRLKPDVNVSPFPPEVQVILRAMQKHGLILADNGSPMYISGAPDDRWDNDVLASISAVKADDFEAVDVSSLIVDPNSGQVAGATPPLPPLPPVAPGGAYTTVEPVRVLDTRAGNGAPVGRVPAGGTVRLDLQGRVPPGASAVVLNVTATDPTQAGYVTVHPCGAPPGNVSNLNSAVGTAVPNLVTVAVGDDDDVCLFTLPSTHLVADLAGWFSAGGDRFTGATPVRLVDTRATGVRVQPGDDLVVAVAGGHGVPASATAAVATVTVTDPAAAGYLTVYSCGTSPPLASNVNYRAGQTVANLAVTKLGTGGAVCVRSYAPAHVLVDLAGWLAPGGAEFTAVAPRRIIDTRDGTGVGAPARLGAGAVLEVSLATGAATAVAVNVTAVQPSTAGYLTVYPCGTNPPLASTLNYEPGEIVPALAIVALGTGGKVCVTTFASTDVVVDLQATFTPP